MNEAFEEPDAQKIKKVKPDESERDNKETGVDTEGGNEVEKEEESTTAKIEEKSASEITADAHEIERRLKELSNETQEKTYSILMGFFINKEASLFYKVVNLLKLFDIIFAFSLELSPTMIIAGVNTIGFLILYFLNKDSLKVKSIHTIASLLLLMSSITVLLTTFKSDYEKKKATDMMSLCLIVLLIWIIQSVVWTCQMGVFSHRTLFIPSTDKSENKQSDLEASSVQNSNLMVSHNMSKDELELEKPKTNPQDSTHQSCIKVNAPEDPISSERGSKKLKRRTKDEPK